jgi:YD repeat-containing protein
MLCAFVFAIGAAAQNITYVYDASGRLALADYGNGTQIAYTYDNSGNLLSRTVVTSPPSSAAPKEKSESEKPKVRPESKRTEPHAPRS